MKDLSYNLNMQSIFTFLVLITILFFSTHGHAKCAISQIQCPAKPTYTLGTLRSLYLANNNMSNPIHTDEIQCIAAAEKMQKECNYRLPVVATFSLNGLLVSNTLVRSYLPKLIFNATAPPVITYSLNPYKFVKGRPIPVQIPSITGGSINYCSISPALPTGLTFGSLDCKISGTPSAALKSTNYTVTATNTIGAGNTVINISVLPISPAVLITIISSIMN